MIVESVSAGLETHSDLRVHGPLANTKLLPAGREDQKTKGTSDTVFQ
jgi:hypothetical protein